MNLKKHFALLTLLFFSVVLSTSKREDDNDKLLENSIVRSYGTH